MSKKVFLWAISFFILLILTTACKTEPEKKDDAPEHNIEEEDKQTEDELRKISDEQFAEALELIERAKKAEADIYDNENLEKSITELQAARDKNENATKEAYVHLDNSRKASQDAYYNTYRKKAEIKRKEADKFITEIESSHVDPTKNVSFVNAKQLYSEGEEAYKDKSYKLAYMKFSDCVEALRHIINNLDGDRVEHEKKMKYVEGLIAEAKKLGAEEYADTPYQSAIKELDNAKKLYIDDDIENSGKELNKAEESALLAIKLTKEALQEIKRKEALRAIMEAGQSLEKASEQKIINEQGETEEGFDYKFEFDENQSEDKLKPAPSDITSYRDILAKAVEYIDKAKYAYQTQDYDMAIRYAKIAKRIADSYTSGGIKTEYVVRLIPERRDCLWRISEYDYIYDNPFYWPAIWKANRKIIMNPDLIFPGQKFVIPEID